MKLVSMKITKQEKAEEKKAETLKQPDYSWGLRLSLDDECMGKLGLDASKMTAGESVSLTAKAKVVSTSVNASEGKKHQGVELQITDMALESGDKSDFDGAWEKASGGKK